jgi:arginyl-tRNA synthetase
MLKQTLEHAVSGALAKLGYPDVPVSLEHPTDLSHGDYATNVALGIAYTAKKDPRLLAEEVVAAMERPAEVAEVTVAGPGFINIRLTRLCLRDSVREVLAQGERWGANDTFAGKKVMVEHTQPNPFKPFHIGHLMSNTIGESISRLYAFSGAEVRRANYQGDVGLHVAKCLWGLKRLQGNPHSIVDLANAYVEGNRAYEDDPGAKQEIVSYNKMVYENAQEIAEDYRIGREVSLEHFETLYALLGSTFDFYFFESESQVPGRVLVKEGLSDGIFKESEGAVVFPGEEYGLHTRVFLTTEGLPTYEAKELGLAQLKVEKWPFDLSLTTTAVEQAEYFKVVHKALGLLRPQLAGRLMHVPHGMMLLTGGKMSSRKGNVVTGESLLNDMLLEARTKVADRPLTDDEKAMIAAAVAVAAIKFSVLKQKVGKNITFDPDKSLSFEGDSGPYLQYAYTRAASVLEKGREAGITPSTELAPREATTLEQLLYRFPEVVLRAREEHEPHHITLASTWNSWYTTEKILDGSATAPYKLALAAAFAQTMKNGLWLLGIQAPEKM